MSDELTPQQSEVYKSIDEATARAMANPKELSETILKGIHDQTTRESPEPMQQSEDGHAETGFTDNSGVTDQQEGLLTQQEIESSLEKGSSGPKLSRNLPVVQANTPEMSGALFPYEDTEVVNDNDEAPISESSEVASLSVQMREVTGVVNRMGSEISEFMSRVESRLTTLEAKTSSGSSLIQHRRTITGPKIPETLIKSPPIQREFKDKSIASLSQLSDLLDRCKEHKYTPSTLSQKQIFISLADGKELTGLELPLSRTQWKPENLVRIVSGFT